MTHDVIYDPTLLNLSGASLAEGMPGDWSLTLDTTTPGVARIAAAGATLLAGHQPMCGIGKSPVAHVLGQWRASSFPRSRDGC